VLIGADVEVSNFIVGTSCRGDTCAEASRMLLNEIRGFPLHHRACPDYNSPASSPYGGRRQDDDGCTGDRQAATGGNPHDMGRTWLPAGTCYYIDMNHLELCIAETRGAKGFVAAWHAAMRVAEGARRTAAARLPASQKLMVLFNNSDGLGNSFGSHLNFLISRSAWDDIFQRKSLFLPFLASFQVASMIITGQGKVGAENGACGEYPLAYQISQRADFLESLRGPQTTYRRPIVNARDESLCGFYRDPSRSAPANRMARLHVISYDSNLCHTACLLKVGMMQIVLAMLQRGCVRADLILDDPVTAAVQISHDPGLEARARTVCGERLTAAELLRRFFDQAQSLVASGGCEGIVPDAGEILRLWDDTLVRLENRDFEALESRLDWVLKKTLIEQAIARHPGMTWASPRARLLDQVYSSSNTAEGLYWACERDGRVERLVSPADVERAVHSPPADTRAWTRGQLLERAGPAAEHVDWDVISFRTSGNGYFGRYRTVDLSDPTAFTRAETEGIFNDAASLEELLDRLTLLARGAGCSGEGIATQGG